MKRFLLGLAVVGAAACGFGPQQYIPVDAPQVKPWQAPEGLAPFPEAKATPPTAPTPAPTPTPAPAPTPTPAPSPTPAHAAATPPAATPATTKAPK